MGRWGKEEGYNKAHKATKKKQREARRTERRKPAAHSKSPVARPDPADLYATQFDNYIFFESTIGAGVIKFKAMLTQYEDQFSSEWNSEQVYGRNDPIQTFRNTTRQISIGWDAPAFSYAEAKTNMDSAAKLVRMLYPSYANQGSVSTINKSPMIKVRFRNLIQGMDGEELLVTLDGISFSPDLEAGWFDISQLREAIIINQDLVPKLLESICTLTNKHITTTK